ncbi:hypothetical protein [Methanothrix sp.]|uniref:hypothetical protein n=1 Tax=Methanothrix sp. TaxID=90426 RepID=UPI003C72E216
MDETDRTRISDAALSMDQGERILLYEVMKKKVGLITLISIFIPGGGQIYQGSYLKGILILLLAWLILPWLYGIYDAHTEASRFNRELLELIYPESMPARADSLRVAVGE